MVTTAEEALREPAEDTTAAGLLAREAAEVSVEQDRAVGGGQTAAGVRPEDVGRDECRRVARRSECSVHWSSEE